MNCMNCMNMSMSSKASHASLAYPKHRTPARPCNAAAAEVDSSAVLPMVSEGLKPKLLEHLNNSPPKPAGTRRDHFSRKLFANKPVFCKPPDKSDLAGSHSEVAQANLRTQHRLLRPHEAATSPAIKPFNGLKLFLASERPKTPTTELLERDRTPSSEQRAAERAAERKDILKELLVTEQSVGKKYSVQQFKKLISEGSPSSKKINFTEPLEELGSFTSSPRKSSLAKTKRIRTLGRCSESHSSKLPLKKKVSFSPNLIMFVYKKD